MGIFNHFLEKTKQNRGRGTGLRKKPVRFETLERREVLSAVTLNLGVGETAVNVECDNTYLDIYVDGNRDVHAPVAYLTDVTINGTSGNQTVMVENLGLAFDGQLTINGGGGTDTITLYDTSQDDDLLAYPTTISFDMDDGNGYSVDANSFEVAYFYANQGGSDVAQLRGSSGNDTAVSTDEFALIQDAAGNPTDFFLRAKFFEASHLYAEAGTDTVTLKDSSGNDLFDSRPDDDYFKMKIGGSDTHFVRAKYFDNVIADFREGGADRLDFYGTAGRDDVHADSNRVDYWSSNGYYIQAVNMQSNEIVYFHGTAGSDRADVDTPIVTTVFYGTWYYSDWYD